MPKKYVELVPDATTASGWKVKHDGKEGDGPTGPKKYPEVDLARDSGPQLVVFTIPPDQPSITFNKNNPMQIQPGPNSPTGGMDSQIADWAVSPDGKMLVLLDLNSNTTQLDLAYRVKADGYTKVLDPIIRNGGTTPPAPVPAYSFAEIAGVAVALILAFVIGLAVQHRFKLMG